MPWPWNKVSPMNLREEFVLLALEPRACMAKLCRQYGISRQNGYKWVRRYREEGIDGLLDQSRRPLGSRVQASGASELIPDRRVRLSVPPQRCPVLPCSCAA